MVNVLLAFDETDAVLGKYFEMCANQASDYFHSKHKTNLIIANSARLNSAFIDLSVANLTPRFIFLAYSHGSDKTLYGNETYISSDNNLMAYANCFFYTFSCFSGIELGKELRNNNCKVFIGYKNEAFVITAYFDLFADCSNSGLFAFLDGSSARDSFKAMKNKITYHIDHTYKNNFFVASVLRSNREALVLHGTDVDINYYYPVE